jgi:hypothetical protein
MNGMRATGGQLTADKMLYRIESGASLNAELIPLGRVMRWGSSAALTGSVPKRTVPQ